MPNVTSATQLGEAGSVWLVPDVQTDFAGASRAYLAFCALVAEALRGNTAVSEDEFNDAIEAYRQALSAFLRGDPEPVLALFSRRDDVTIANPLGPPQRGRTDVEHAIRAAATNFREGTLRFEEISRYNTADLGYVVQLEPSEVQLAATNHTVRISLRVTMIFRREEGTWKVAHRHADPITTARPITTAVET